ncbi:hydroquinone glucosyltransferase-like [Rutidosis leptorrhynchoides]|uniref:hydroquinone glucosyltransferase-like n=1 Tax=Rutidosis leptorrhynchoides TaxID=125765 RepID=UPI003A99EC55
MEKPPHIAFVPSPGMGHLIPLVEFAKRLANLHNLSSTLIIPNDGPLSNSQSAFLDSLPNPINYIILPPVNLDDLSQDTKIETRISLMVTRSIRSLHEAFKSMISDKKIVALFVDLFGTDAFDVANDFGVPSYLFFPASAMTLSLLLHLPKLDQTISFEYKDLPDPIHITGCIPIHGRDLLDPLQDRTNDGYKWVLHNAKRFMMAKGIVVNSFKELEAGTIQNLHHEQPGKPTLYPVGPLAQSGSNLSRDVNESNCLKWLDGQPSGSVLYICFGSGGTLSSHQVNELAMGLELSGQRFLWVVKAPNDTGIPNATYLNFNDQIDNFNFLPKGFLERTKNYGLVVLSWAPQVQILNHGSTGGFLTHCGWNSVLETVGQGLPMIVWPLYAEQKMNALMLTEGLHVALRPKPNEDGIVDHIEIARVVKGLFEGEEGLTIRNRIKKLQEAAVNALREDGCSTKTLHHLASTLKNEV